MNEEEPLQLMEPKYCLRCGNPLRKRMDHEGKERSVCGACGWTYYRNPVPAVAILVLNDAGELLLVKRKFAPQAGKWALPSGYMEVFLTPEENAVEELREETGLEGEISHFISWYFGYSPIYERVLSLGFRLRVTGGKLQAGDDASDARFFPLDSLPPIAFAAHRKFIHLETGLPLDY
jgi:ADP-ribose pyrophosphatase YjhB (NUDIX family)